MSTSIHRPSRILTVVLLWTAGLTWLSCGALRAQTPAPTPAPASTPMSDATYSSTMKQIAATFRSLRINNKAMNHGDGAREAGRLANWFSDVEIYWKAKGVKDAVADAQAAIAAARAIEMASTSMNMATLATSETALAEACERCHKAHREMRPDGTFGFK
jgi:hypothetical protein